jgi:hypothetical protein
MPWALRSPVTSKSRAGFIVMEFASPAARGTAPTAGGTLCS